MKIHAPLMADRAATAQMENLLSVNVALTGRSVPMQWTIDPTHSHIQFAVRHLGLSTVRGTFGDLSGAFEEDNGDVASGAIEIDMTSINTNMATRDEHLRGPDFFDVATYPTARFDVTRSVRDDGDISITGDLTIRGVTKPVTFKGELAGPAKDPWGNTKMSASLEGNISRKEWGLTWNQTLETGGLLVSDEVKLTIDVQAVAAVPVPA
jgi:polyisoprenoid-binding protein YceI